MDLEGNGLIDSEKIKTCLQELVSLSIDILPQIASENQILSKLEINAYMSKLKKREKSFIETFTQEILNDHFELSQVEFMDSLKHITTLVDLTSTTGIRSVLADEMLEETSTNEESAELFISNISEIVKIEVVEVESPELEYTSSDEELLDNLQITKKQFEKKIRKNEINNNPNAKKPPRPFRSSCPSKTPSPDSSFTLNSPTSTKPLEKELWKENGEKKTVKKFRCRSVANKEEESVRLKYILNGKNVEIELNQWEDPIRVAHNFSVKNKLIKKERNNIALLLTKLRKKTFDE